MLRQLSCDEYTQAWHSVSNEPSNLNENTHIFRNNTHVKDKPNQHIVGTPESIGVRESTQGSRIVRCYESEQYSTVLRNQQTGAESVQCSGINTGRSSIPESKRNCRISAIW